MHFELNKLKQLTYLHAIIISFSTYFPLDGFMIDTEIQINPFFKRLLNTN